MKKLKLSWSVLLVVATLCYGVCMIVYSETKPFESQIEFQDTGHDHSGATAGNSALKPATVEATGNITAASYKDTSSSTNTISYDPAEAGSQGAWSLTSGAMVNKAAYPSVGIVSALLGPSLEIGAGLVGRNIANTEDIFWLFGIEDGAAKYTSLRLGNDAGFAGSIQMFDGTSTFYGTISVPIMTSDLTWTMPSSSGTVALTSMFALYLPLAGGTMSGNINMGTNDITNAGTVSATTLSGDGAAVTNVNAETVDSVHASSTAVANYLYPLDGSAKVPNAVLYTGSGGGLDADTVDTKHAADLVLKTGDTMTGPLNIATSSTDDLLDVSQSGTARAAEFYTSHATSTSHTIYSHTDGLGRAGSFYISNPANSNAALYAATAGTDSAIYGSVTGGGNAITASSSGGGNSLYSINSGTGNSAKAYTTGTGRAFYAQIFNLANSADAIEARTNGGGTAGDFEIDNATNSATIILANTTGTGNLLDLQKSTVSKFTVDNDGNLDSAGQIDGATGFTTVANATASRFVSTAAGGTAPFSITSTTVSTNLNADLLDGNDEAAFFKLADDETVDGVPNFNGGLSGATPPFNVDSTFVVTNLNCDLLDGSHAAAFAPAGDYVLAAGDTMTGKLTIDPSSVTTPGTMLDIDVTGSTDAVATAYIHGNNTNAANSLIYAYQSGPGIAVNAQIAKATSSSAANSGLTNGVYPGKGVYGQSTNTAIGVAGLNSGYSVPYAAGNLGKGSPIYGHLSNTTSGAPVIGGNSNSPYNKLLSLWSGTGGAETAKFSVENDGSTLMPASTYINFGTATGTSGYGFFDNAGTLQWKNSGGAWTALGASAVQEKIASGSVELAYNGNILGMGLTGFEVTEDSFINFPSSASGTIAIGHYGTMVNGYDILDASNNTIFEAKYNQATSKMELIVGGTTNDGKITVNDDTGAGVISLDGKAGAITTTGTIKSKAANAFQADAATSYINLSSTAGDGGRGIRNNAGTLEWQATDGGGWNAFAAASPIDDVLTAGNVASIDIKLVDGVKLYFDGATASAYLVGNDAYNAIDYYGYTLRAKEATREAFMADTNFAPTGGSVACTGGAGIISCNTGGTNHSYPAYFETKDTVVGVKTVVNNASNNWAALYATSNTTHNKGAAMWAECTGSAANKRCSRIFNDSGYSLTVESSGEAIMASIDKDGNIDSAGSLEWGTSATGPESAISSNGCYTIELTNKSGGAITQGTVVFATDAAALSIDVLAANGENPVGMVQDSSCANDAVCAVGVIGKCYVKYGDDNTCTAGDYVRVDDEAGRAGCSASAASTVAEINKGLGRALESEAATGQVSIISVNLN